MESASFNNYSVAKQNLSRETSGDWSPGFALELFNLCTLFTSDVQTTESNAAHVTGLL